MSTYRWRATVNVWPFATGDGSEADQKACGPREVKTEFVADSIEEAISLTKVFVLGIKTNPRVWQAPIFALERIA